MSQENMQHIQKRLNQYWYVDGISEIGFGLLCLVLGSYFFLIENLDENSMFQQILSIGFVLILIGAAFAINRLVVYLKNRITYPRTGFVAYRRVHSRWRLLVGGLAGMMSASLTIILTRLPSSLNWLPLISGMMFTLVSLFIAFRIGLVRYVLVAIAAFLLGIYLSQSPPGDYAGLPAFYLALGFLLCAIGVFILWRYIRTNETLAEDQDDEKSDE